MTQTADELQFVGAMAAQIDRVVIRGHQLAGEAIGRSQRLPEMKAFRRCSAPRRSFSSCIR